VNTTNSDESGLTVDITSVDSNGSITALTLNSVGTTSNNSYLTIQSGTNWGPTLRILDTGSVSYDGSVNINLNGSNYVNSVYEKCFNMSANNLLVNATVENNVQLPVVPFTFIASEVNALFSYVTSVSVFNVTDITRYPLGTRVRMISTQSNPDNWAIFEVDSNDGVTMTLALTNEYGGRNVYPLGTYVYATEIVDYPHPSVRILTNDDGTINTVNMIEIPNINREDDIILIPQKESDKNFLFELKSNVNRIQTFKSKRLKGGAGYVYSSSLLSDTYNYSSSISSLNNGIILNPGGIDSTASITIGPTTYDSKSLIQASHEYNVSSTYSGIYGDVQTIDQTVSTLNLQNQPGGGTDFVSYIHRNTATFIQEVRYLIQDLGSGYTVGEYTTTGGNGTNMSVYVLKVNDTGGVLKVRTSNIGEGYEYNDILTITGGNNDSIIKLKIPQSRELILVNQRNPSIEYIDPVLLFTPEIVDPGTGYTVGTFNTTCPVYESASTIQFSLQVIINEVGLGGEIRDIEFLLPESSLTVNSVLMYQIGYNVIVSSGNEDAIIKLRKPTKARIMEYTDGGTNYTTENGVETFNISQNNLAVLCDTTGGQCLAYDYTNTEQGLSFWDLSRYQVGDVLQLNQDGNVSATVEITAITFNSITFNQLTNGVGYVDTGDAYVPTINTSVTNTTVDIIANGDGNITSSIINTLGTRTRYNDALVLTQSGSDNNSVIQIASERDVPAPSQVFENGRSAIASEWNAYKSVLESSVNLLDSQVLVDITKNYPNYYNASWYYYGDPDNKDPNTVGLQLDEQFP
jgi:hypothetical protein